MPAENISMTCLEAFKRPLFDIFINLEIYLLFNVFIALNKMVLIDNVERNMMNFKGKIGYACITLGVPDVGLKSCRLSNASDSRLKEIIENNILSLKNTIEYNIKNNIKLFRISSDIIPFASHPQVSIRWCELFADELAEVGRIIKKSGMRVSMHPGQYTVLNSPDEDVVARAVDDLRYHSYFMDCLKTDSTNKIILHGGGVYGDKAEAIKRFIDNYEKLDESIKKRLVIENDEINYNIEEVLYIAEKVNTPAVFDNLHHAINPPETEKSEREWIEQCAGTWANNDGIQKMHYSQQDIKKRNGAHSKTIFLNQFKAFLDSIDGINIDIMLEVKDKNISAVKCITSVLAPKNIKFLEEEWSRYKYYVLGKYPQGYYEIRELLKDKQSFKADKFYSIIEKSYLLESRITNEVNALQHTAGYFKNKWTMAQKRRILKNIKKYENGQMQLMSVKNSIYRLAVEYNIEYLLNSYYFIDL